MTATSHLVAVANQSNKICQATAQKPYLGLHLYSDTMAEVPALYLSSKRCIHFDFNGFFLKYFLAYLKRNN